MKDSEILSMLNGITDDQAEYSDIGGDSDAEDCLPIEVSVNSSVTRSLNSSGHSSTPQAHNVESPFTPSPSSSVSLNQNLRPKRARRVLLEQIPNTSSSDDMDDPDKDPDVCFLPLAPISDTSSSDDDDATENPQIENSNFKWSKNGQTPNHFSRFKFNEKFGFNVEVDNLIMLNYFALFVNSTFLNLVVNESNLYAAQSNTELNLSVPELQAFIGILIIMGFNRLPSMRLYWSDDENFHSKRIADIMPVKRFLKIIRFLHLNDNTKMLPRSSLEFDRLYKIRPMIKHLNTVFPEMFSPSRFMSVDESMIAFTGSTTCPSNQLNAVLKFGF
ncbi:unnamed protein product [Macrosiphum euphorbiae]|uniref:PiggyBac transposable element-derived protein domain-containing protein n=1 Tax=Macrosiphum euphorbiae TaxID=13131 RepID=A0AAV0Y9X9_9HEMI|nr:unnamed protein product [Macrosiphum euphorbiae]